MFLKLGRDVISYCFLFAVCHDRVLVKPSLKYLRMRAKFDFIVVKEKRSYQTRDRQLRLEKLNSGCGFETKWARKHSHKYIFLAQVV